MIIVEYEVVTVTGNARGAGTNANVFLTIFGKSGQTPKLALRNSDHDDMFERSQSDVFHLKTKCVGPLNKIRCRMISNENKVVVDIRLHSRYPTHTEYFWYLSLSKIWLE